MSTATETQGAKPWRPGLFDFIDAVGNSKRDLISEDPAFEKDYNPWMMNVGFSLGMDSIFWANEMNLKPGLSKKMQHDFYLHVLASKKRFNKWPKKMAAQEDVDILARYLGCSTREAARMVDQLSDEDRKIIREGTMEGGKMKC